MREFWKETWFIWTYGSLFVAQLVFMATHMSC